MKATLSLLTTNRLLLLGSCTDAPPPKCRAAARRDPSVTAESDTETALVDRGKYLEAEPAYRFYVSDWGPK